MITHTVTLIPGDGIGPEIVRAAQRLIEAAGLKIRWETCNAGKAVFEKGIATGIPLETIESIKQTKIVLKGPLETPIGYGEKSANVTLRALFNTYANTRPVRHIPGIKTPFSTRPIDFVIVRENTEDLYSGIEYLQTPSVAEALKLITRKGSEQIIRFAFEFARAEGRRKVHCATKANILKFTEGLFKKTFEDISQDYPDIEAQHILIDNCAHQLVVRPEIFDVIVTTNLHGDIISDLGAGLVGGLGVAPSANMGNEVAIFEAVHGSAPDIAGQNIANPTALILSSILMLRHLNEFEVAHCIEQALLYTLGVQHTLPKDLDKISSLTTSDFTDTVINNLGKKTEFWAPRPYKPLHLAPVKNSSNTILKKEVGFDLYIESSLPPKVLGQNLEKMALPFPFELKMISNRGMQVYPAQDGLTSDPVDHWCARFLLKNKEILATDADILAFVKHIGRQYRWMHLEKLCEFNHIPGFTKAQGEA